MSDGAVRKIGPYLIGRTLGEGGFSKVKLGQHEQTGELVALKLLKSSAMDKNALKQVEGEIRAMAAVHHRNVLRLKDFNYAADYPKKNGKVTKVMLVVLECAKGGELFEFLSATGQFEEAIARTYFHQLMEGVGYCHSKNVVHRDLKPENLLFDEDFVLKIADFGFSKAVDATNTMYTQCGTPGYMAPEMFEHQGYDAKKADLWACGVILFIMIAGFPPFQKPNVSDWWFHKLKNNRHELFWRAHCRTVYFSDNLKDLLNKILCPDATCRISLEDIQKHSWFKGPTVPDATLKQQLQDRKNKVDQAKVRDEMSKLAKERGGAVGQSLGSGPMATVRALGAECDDSVLPPTMEFFSHGIETAAQSLGGGMDDMGGMSMGGMGGLSLGGEEEKDQQEAALFDSSFASYTTLESDEKAPALFDLLAKWADGLTSDFSSKRKAFKVKAKITTENGVVALEAQVYRASATGGRHVVALTRRSGDGMQFRALFAQLREAMGGAIVKA